MILIIILAAFGLIGIIAGIWAFVNDFLTIRRNGWSLLCPPHYLSTLVLGVLLSWVSWQFEVIGYPLYYDDGRWWFVGKPFFVACFDHRGRGYIGFLSEPSVIGNAIFWFLVPRIVLSLHFTRLLTRKENPEHSQ